MIYINPQWQGSGYSDHLKFGAETFELYFEKLEKTIIPLSNKDLTIVDNIKCFEPILEQSYIFKDLIELQKPNCISTLGGDCGIEIVPISYLNKLYNGDLCVVWIDAHADLNTPKSSPSKTFHGMPLRTLLGEGNEKFVGLLFSILKPEQLCFVGLRDIDEPEKDYILKHNIKSIADCKFTEVLEKVKNFNNVYIHLDLDVLDKSEFEFTMFPTNNGFTVEDLAKLISELKLNTNVVGFCITESTASKIEQLHPIKPIIDQVELKIN